MTLPPELEKKKIMAGDIENKMHWNENDEEEIGEEEYFLPASIVEEYLKKLKGDKE